MEREGRGTLLAVPATKSRISKRGSSEAGGGKMGSRVPHKLVARMEDFYYIISTYHNNTTGHHGIRKTYGMVS